MEQCAEGYRRMRLAKQARRRGRKPESQPQIFLGGRHRGSVAESGVRPEPTPPAYREEPRRSSEPELVLEVSEAETVKELMGKLEERYMRELLCWCMRHGIRPTERVGDLMTPGSALHTRPEVRASRLVKMVPASCTRPPVHLASLARPVPSQHYSALRSANHGECGAGLAPCYAVVRTVSPVRVLSPVRYIPASHICRARVKIQPGRLVPALLSRSPVRLHGPVHPVPPPHTSPPVAAPRTRLPVRVLGPVPPMPAPRIRPTVRPACPALPEPSSSPAQPESPACPALSELPPLMPETPETLIPEAPVLLSPALPEPSPALPELPV
ncbi:proline-rich protein 36-like [Oncorhynchus nerka]|uniref:proline-rich protein 36-like n=1 Tax=Oncorhynchus nerka TaxID=8023 RepID=UPI0031B80D91